MQTQRWSKERAQAWAQTQPWWVGCNFIPSTACNQLEMWQAETFDPATIERELGWAAEVGMNGVRVYLHDLAWQADPTGFKSRIDTFLQLADQAGIRTVFVLFDDCWFPPVPGPQPDPVPGVHNSRWAQGPGHRVVRDRKQWPRLQRYVEDIVGSFREDERIGMWDLYNEPGNALLPLASLPNYLAIPRLLAPLFRHFILPSPSLALLQLSFVWARSVDPSSAPYCGHLGTHTAPQSFSIGLFRRAHLPSLSWCRVVGQADPFIEASFRPTRYLYRMDGAASGQSSRITPADFQGRTGRLFLLGSGCGTDTNHPPLAGPARYPHPRAVAPRSAPSRWISL